MEPDIPIDPCGFACAVEKIFDGDALLGTAGAAAMLVERVEHTPHRARAPLIFSETITLEVTPEDRLKYHSYEALVRRSNVPEVVRRAANVVLAEARMTHDNIVTIARLDRPYLNSVVSPWFVHAVLASEVRCQAKAVPRWLPWPHLPTRALIDRSDAYRFAFVLDPTVAFEAELVTRARGREAEVSIRLRRVASERVRLIEVHALEIYEFERPWAVGGPAR